MSVRFRDPIHGFISFSQAELAVIDSRPFQRLRHIGQLALTDHVFPGATHTRFGHALGVAHVASRMVDALARDAQVRDLLSWGEAEWARARQLVRLAALVHDLGHAPFSHAGEELFAHGQRHEQWSARLLRETELADIIARTPEWNGEGIDVDAIVAVFDAATWRGQRAGTTDQRLARIDLDDAGPLLSLLLAGQIDADRCDYLLRDARYCGVQYGVFDLDRLLETYTAWRLPEGGLAPGVRHSGLCAAENMVTARYLMYREVYYHKTRRALDVLLERALRALLPGGHLPAQADAYLAWDDHRAWQLLREGAANGEPHARALLSREPLSCVLQIEETGLTGGDGFFEEVVAALEPLARRYGPLGLITDTSAAIRVFRPPEELRGKAARPRDEIYIVDRAGRGRSLFTVSAILRRMHHKAQIQRVYVARPLREEALAIIDRLSQGASPSQMALGFAG